MEPVNSEPPREEKRGKWLVVGLVVLFLVLVTLGGYLWQKDRTIPLSEADLPTTQTGSVGGGNVTVASESQSYGLRLLDLQGLNTFLQSEKFWEQTSRKLPGGMALDGPVSELKVVYTDSLQPYNVEETPNGPLGSVKVELKDSVMIINVQTAPQKLSGIDKSWHLESQLLRIINDMAPEEINLEDNDLITRYQDLPRMIELYEK